MQVSARADYALRAMAELAAARMRASGESEGRAASLTGAEISEAQDIPRKFLQNILFDLNRAGLAKTQRGSGGGYRLARKPEEITLADVIRAVEGPLANVRGEWPEDLAYTGSSEPLAEVWIALRASIRSVLEKVTLRDVASGGLPEEVSRLTRDASAWEHS
ncbi:RrF2 family transcriptional regulator [soil metagenome]|jgi:Rrf2 family protein